MTKSELEAKKLTGEQYAHLDEFIKRCVYTNVLIPILSNKPVTANSTVQELLHNTSLETLDVFYGKLGRMIELQDTGESIDDDKPTKYYAGNLTARDVKDGVKLIYKMRKHIKLVKEHQQAITAIEKELEGYKTTPELRSEAESRLASLKG